VVGIDRSGTEATVVVAGGPPEPDAAALRTLLDEAGLGSLDVRVRFVPEREVTLPGS
jgi:hypothetical protein